MRLRVSSAMDCRPYPVGRTAIATKTVPRASLDFWRFVPLPSRTPRDVTRMLDNESTHDAVPLTSMERRMRLRKRLASEAARRHGRRCTPTWPGTESIG